MTVDDLFHKIGVLTVENDALRAELKRVSAELEALRASASADKSDKSDEEKKD